MESSFHIIVDADSCPVKKEIITAGQACGVHVILVASYDHFLSEEGSHVTVVQVDPSDQSADLHIANRIRSGDVLVTGDYGLAALGLAKGAHVISPRGLIFTDHNMDELLERRHAHAKLRRSGKYAKGPKPFTAQEKQEFLQSMTKLLIHLQENRFL